MSVRVRSSLWFAVACIAMIPASTAWANPFENLSAAEIVRRVNAGFETLPQREFDDLVSAYWAKIPANDRDAPENLTLAKLDHCRRMRVAVKSGAESLGQVAASLSDPSVGGNSCGMALSAAYEMLNDVEKHWVENEDSTIPKFSCGDLKTLRIPGAIGKQVLLVPLAAWQRVADKLGSLMAQKEKTEKSPTASAVVAAINDAAGAGSPAKPSVAESATAAKAGNTATSAAPVKLSPEQQDLVEQVRESAQKIVDYAKHDYERSQLEEFKLDTADSKEVFASAKECVASLDAANAAGLDGAALKVRLEYTSEGKKTSGDFTLDQTRSEVCQVVRVSAAAAYYQNRVFQIVGNVAPWMEELKNNTVPPNNVEVVRDFALECIRTVDEALANGAPPTLPITANNRQYPLSAINEKVCGKSSKLAGAALAKLQAEEAAKFAPYVKLLDGDKLKIFNETYRRGENVYGNGGKTLKAPADFKSASTWITYGVNRRALLPRWRMTIFKFSGTKKSGVSARNGWGDEPPAEEFR